MQPTLNPHNYLEDYVFVSRWAVRNLEVERGEIVCLVSPKNPNDRLLKRIVGLQGTVFLLPNVAMRLNDFRVAGDVVATIGYKKSFIKIPEGHCWIEGDNTGFSMDSNSFGPVSLGLVQSRAMCVVWPPSRWQFLQTKIKRSVEDD